MEIKPGICVYAHYVGEQIVYIGMGTLERAFRVAFRPKVWQDITSNGYKVVVLCWFDNRRDASQEEQKLIRAFNPLCNFAHSEKFVSHAVGCTWNIGRKHSEESKKKVSEAQKISWQKTKHQTGHRRPIKPIKCLDTGIIYNGLREAARQTGAHPSTISSCINGKRKHAAGLRFEKIG
jgi:hypothetical protein